MNDPEFTAAMTEYLARVAQAEQAFPENMSGYSGDHNRRMIWRDIVGDDD